jgi:hypothetical protein
MSTANIDSQLLNPQYIAHDFDDIRCELAQVYDAIGIYNEVLDDELSFLKAHGDAYARHFAQRYNILSSLLTITLIRMNQVIEEIDRYNNSILAAVKATNPA